MITIFKNQVHHFNKMIVYLHRPSFASWLGVACYLIQMWKDSEHPCLLTSYLSQHQNSASIQWLPKLKRTGSSNLRVKLAYCYIYRLNYGNDISCWHYINGKEYQNVDLCMKIDLALNGKLRFISNVTFFLLYTLAMFKISFTVFLKQIVKQNVFKGPYFTSLAFLKVSSSLFNVYIQYACHQFVLSLCSSMYVLVEWTMLKERCSNYKRELKNGSVYYTERQKKLIASLGRRSLKSALSKLIIFGHKLSFNTS